ncbi:MAG: hypothetical protein B7Y39_02020 [Bdellovibrio sp. 28-41-41]|nr:MAG: hypothetical protein B7Y39_02020 [Bdellovibrio sp. 28-41-41]
MDPIYLNSVYTVKPKNLYRQAELSQWIAQIHQRAESFKPKDQQTDSDLIEKFFLRYGVKDAQISERYFECSDVFTGFSDHSDIYKITTSTPNGVDITERSRFFLNRSYEVLQKFYDVSTVQIRPDHLIHVTCTGYVSPSAAQKIVAHQNWHHSTDITHAYHMGCYASLPAIRLARGLVNTENLSVDVVHNEMCGLHMNPQLQTPEQMVVQTLFADGHAKYTVSKTKSKDLKNLKILAISEKVLPDSEMDMSWIPGPYGMQMSLSRNVPPKIKGELMSFSTDLFSKAELTNEQAMKSVFAIHPGGPKIIDAVQETLGLSANQIAESRRVLLQRGNMSSATLPHVWQEILLANYPLGTKMVSYAFGPGLTLFGAVFEIC